MNFKALGLSGCYLVHSERLTDERGFFARSFCAQEFDKAGLVSAFVQENISFNEKRGTLRGLHYQKSPHAEVKIVRCLQGSLVDVILDLRVESKTFGQWVQVELQANKTEAIYIPRGCAHGFQTLQDNTLLHYQMSASYDAALAVGVRWNDPDLNITWPLSQEVVVSPRDQALPSFSEVRQDPQA